MSLGSFVTLSINDTQHKHHSVMGAFMLSVKMLSITLLIDTLSVIMLNVFRMIVAAPSVDEIKVRRVGLS
jgi:hypothetical protein